MRYCQRLSPAALAVLASPVFATSVPGSGVDQFLGELLIVLVGGAIAGVVAGASSRPGRHFEMAFWLPLVLAFGAVALLSGEYERDGNLGTLLVGIVPYVATFFIGTQLRSRRRGRV